MRILKKAWLVSAFTLVLGCHHDLDVYRPGDSAHRDGKVEQDVVVPDLPVHDVPGNDFGKPDVSMADLVKLDLPMQDAPSPDLPTPDTTMVNPDVFQPDTGLPVCVFDDPTSTFDNCVFAP